MAIRKLLEVLEENGGKNPKSKYKFVYFQRQRERSIDTTCYWAASIHRGGKKVISKVFKDEEDAGKAVDLALIKLGEEPVNGFYKRKGA